MSKKIQEFVSMPVFLKLETTIDGIKFYSSDSLKKNFVEAFEKSSKGSHISKEIQSLVEKNLIIPCYKSKNLLSFIRRRIFSGPERYIVGFYHREEKKVLILIENKISIIGTAANNVLVSTTLHESMHLAAGQNLSGFMRIFNSNLKLYYTEFIKDYFKVDSPNSKSIDDLIKYIATFERRGAEYTNQNLKNYFSLLASLFMEDSKLTQTDFDQRLTHLIVAIKIFVVNTPTFIRQVRNFSVLLRSLNQAYENAFRSKNEYTLPIQELMSVSEVACVLAEMIPRDSSITKIFKMLA